MRIAVVGAGIVGVSCAFELACEGHEVTVLEQRGSVAAEASFGHPGLHGPGAAAPWALDVPWHAWPRWSARASRLRLGGWPSWAQASWWWQHRLACRTRGQAARITAVQRLAQASLARVQALTSQHELDHQHSSGCLVLLRSPQELQQQQPALALLAELGAAFEVVTPDRARDIEPALNASVGLHAALHFPQGGAANARQFAQWLKAQAVRLGAVFRFDARVVAVGPGASPMVILADGSSHGFDAIVLCTGAAAEMLAPWPTALPLQAVWGCALTVPVNHIDDRLPQAPLSALVDERFKVGIARLGQRIRIAGTAELGRLREPPRRQTLGSLQSVLEHWFPGGGVMREAQTWQGARPMLPDGLPVLGASGLPGLWFNLGHGASGWALAQGSAQVLAACLSGRDAGIDVAAFAPTRWR